MILPRLVDAKHKQQMLRLLVLILADKDLRLLLQFKGGSYAVLRGVLDRFSVDLDFDLPDKLKKKQVRKSCYKIFKDLGLKIKDESKRHLQFFLKYEAGERERNTLKLEINDQVSKENKYEKVYLKEINMYCQGHTIGTMVANKLVASKARFDKNGKLAGRDFYDLWYFLLNDLPVNKTVVEDLTKMKYKVYLKELVKLIKTELTNKKLNQDLNPLLPVDRLNEVIKFLKPELVRLLSSLVND